MKDRSDKLDFIKIKDFCNAKGIINIMERKAMDWEKYFQKYT
jgi:hypothetical protein